MVVWRDTDSDGRIDGDEEIIGIAVVIVDTTKTPDRGELDTTPLEINIK